MAGMSLSGISSGLDTASIVDQLIAVESNPQVLLKQKLAKQNLVVSALQGINTRIASLATNATALAKPEVWTTPAATSSSTSVTLATTAGAGTGSLSFNVTGLATKASWTTAAVSAGSSASLSVSIAVGSGAAVDVSATGDASALAKAINDAELGVDATVVRSGTDAAGTAQYRVLITGQSSGSANDVQVTSATLAPARLAAGANATLALADGSTLTSATNTFTGLLSGVDVTVSKKEDGVTVTSAPDTAAVAKQAAGVVGALNVVFSEMAEKTKAVAGGTSGVLVGSSLMRGIQQQLATAVSTSVPGASLSDLGIKLTREGSVTIDQAVFTAYAAKEPAKARELTAAFASALATVATEASTTGTGNVSQAITSSQTGVKDLDSRIDAWDDRLALRRTTLERQFAALEVAMNRSQSTSSWLSGALAGLPSYS